MFPVFLGGLLGYMNFRHWLNDVLALDVWLIFLCSCRNLVQVRQEFLSIVFCKVVFYFYMELPLLGMFKKVSVYFLFYECF